MPIEPFEFTYTLTSQASENEVLNALGKTRVKEFEPKSFFFTESNIPEQTSSTCAYGPDGTTKFNITTQFDLTDKKAYAVTSGQVLIVPQSGTGNETKVNVFIKPLSHIDVGVPIKYYVYRGLKKASFINTVDTVNYIITEGSVSNPFMAKVWIDLKGLNPDIGTEVPATVFGFNTANPIDTRLDAKFFNVVEDTTTEDHKIYNLPIIAAGQHFGEFADNTGGFEIVLNDGFYYQEKSDTGFEFDMKYAKSAKVTLNTADIVATPDVSEKIYRENVQKFLDPAAFYGAHITEKEKGQITVVDTSAKYSSKEDIYDNVVSKFYNKHKCYLYIQCNRGRSFNFDETLGTEPLKIGVSETVLPREYKTDGWPIIISDFEQTHNDGETDAKKGVNNLLFELKFKTVNKKASLYNTYGNCANDAVKGNFLSSEALIDDENIATQEYTNTIKYKLINNYNLSSASLTTKSIASFIYINQEEKEVEYFNDFFGPINIKPIIKLHYAIPNSVIQKVINKKLKLKIRDGIPYISDQGLIINGQLTSPIPPALPDDNRTRLYVLKKLNSTNDEDRTFSQFLSTDSGYGYASTKEEYGAYVYGNKTYTIWKGKITDGSEAINTLQLINFEEDTNVTNFMQLGLTEVDFNNLIYNSDEIIDHSTHIPADATNLFFHLDDSGITQNSTYKKYKLGIKYQIYSLLGYTESVVYPTSNDVYIYTIDGYYFFTKNFSEKFEFAEEFGDAVINFRTKPDYAGEFGFDWLRVGDNGEPSYENSIVSGYEERSWSGFDWDTEYDTSPEAFEALKKEYINIKTRKSNEIYYVPYLNIYPQSAIGTPAPPSTVSIKGELVIDEDLEKISYEYDTSLFSVISDPSTQSMTPLGLLGGSSRTVSATITCLKEFEKDQIIKVIATSKNPDELTREKVIGVIKVCKNSKQANRKTVQAVFVRVKTNVKNSTSFDADPEFTYPNFIGIDEKNHLSKTLFQSLIYGENFETCIYELDMSTNLEFQEGGEFFEDPYILDNGPVQDYLITKLNNEAPKFKNYIKVFVFAVKGKGSDPLVGRANGIGSRSCAIYQDRNIATLSHEFLHAVGLYHTHADGSIDNPNQKYVYPNANNLSTTDKPKATNNIMSYNGALRKTTWKWQWKILKSILNKKI